MGNRGFKREIRPGTLGQGNPAQYDYDTIAAYLKNADPAVLLGISRAYAMASRALQAVEQSLPVHANRLSSVWKGSAQELGLEDLRRLTQAAGTLATTSQHFQTAMNSGFAALKTAQFGMPARTTPLGVLPPKDPIQAEATKRADDGVAQKHLAQTNAKLVSSFGQIPDSITLTLPKEQKEGEPFGGSPGGGGTSAGAPGSGGPGAGGGSGSLPGGGSSPGGITPHHPVHANPSGSALTPPHGGPGAGLHAGNPSDLQGAPPAGPGHPSSGPGLPGPSSPMPGTDQPGARPPGGGPVPVIPPAQGIPSSPPRRGPGADGLRPLPSGGQRMGPGGRTPTMPSLGGGDVHPGGVLGGPNSSGIRSSLMGPFGDGVEHSRLTSRGVIGGGPATAAEAEAMGTGTTGARQGVGPAMGAGGGPGHPGQEKEREVQLPENDDLWSEDHEVAPRVIGDPE